MFCIFIQACGIGLKKRCHLVDEGTGTSGADTVHTLFHVAAFKINDFRILTAQLDGNISLWRVSLQCLSDGNHFLHKRYVQILGQSKPAGSGDNRIHMEGT